MKPYEHTVSGESQTWEETGQRPRDAQLLGSGNRTAEESVVIVMTGQNKVSATCPCSPDLSFLLFDQYGMGSSTKASFTPFVDPRVYQTSPTDEDEEDDESSAAGEEAGPGGLVISVLSSIAQWQNPSSQRVHHLLLPSSLS